MCKKSYYIQTYNNSNKITIIDNLTRDKKDINYPELCFTCSDKVPIMTIDNTVIYFCKDLKTTLNTIISSAIDDNGNIDEKLIHCKHYANKYIF